MDIVLQLFVRRAGYYKAPAGRMSSTGLNSAERGGCATYVPDCHLGLGWMTHHVRPVWPGNASHLSSFACITTALEGQSGNLPLYCFKSCSGGVSGQCSIVVLVGVSWIWHLGWYVVMQVQRRLLRWACYVCWPGIARGWQGLAG